MKNALLCSILLCYAFGVQAQGYEIEKRNMPRAYAEYCSELTYPMAWGNSPIKNFSRWRNTARNQLITCLERKPAAPKDFAMEVLTTEKRDGYEARKIAFNISAYTRVTAYLLVPDGTEKHPAMLMLHDHGAKFNIGKEKMVRPFDVSPEILAEADKWSVQCYDSVYTGDYFARAGYVVLSVDALFWGDRGGKDGSKYDDQQALSANLLQMGLSWCGVITWDDIESVEFLTTLPEVNADKIGAVGFSMGAHRAWMLAAATDKVKAAAAVCWMNVTDSLMTLKNNQNRGQSAYSMIVPGIRNYMDYPHVASIACPKPMLFFNGLKDKLFPVNGVECAYAEMHKVWNSQKADDKLITKLWDTPHFFSKEMHTEILQFFDKNLK